MKTTTPLIRTSIARAFLRSGFIFTAVALARFGILPTAEAVNPPPDGGYPGNNTAEGQGALLSLTTGIYNTALGAFSLRSNTTGKFNTASGAGTLFANSADQNTAIGAGALFSNTTGSQNTANGAFALFSNTTGNSNAPNGVGPAGSLNTANGASSLFSNITGDSNTANGVDALFHNTTGSVNTANGVRALFSNTTGDSNTAVGDLALQNNATGSGNIALGHLAGGNVTFADNVICIGNLGQNVSNSCYIGHIFGVSSGGTSVFIDVNGRLGTGTSSRRFKEEIQPMERASEALFALKPVTFRYKKEIDPACISQFGLVAEEVENVNPDLVVRDKEGKPYSVRYDQVNAMLLNEFLKAHAKLQQQQATIEKQQKQIQALTSGLQKVSDQLELKMPSARTADNH